MHYALIALVFAVATVGCDKASTDSPTGAAPTTQSASVAPKALGGAECQKDQFKNDSRCDWYFDPMREAQPSDAPKSK